MLLADEYDAIKARGYDIAPERAERCREYARQARKRYESGASSRCHADQAESWFYALVAAFWTRAALGLAFDECHARLCTDWAVYAEENNARVASSRPIKGRQHPYSGEPATYYRWVSPTKASDAEIHLHSLYEAIFHT